MQSFIVTALIGCNHAVQMEMLQDSTQTLDKVLAQTGLGTDQERIHSDKMRPKIAGILQDLDEAFGATGEADAEALRKISELGEADAQTLRLVNKIEQEGQREITRLG